MACGKIPQKLVQQIRNKISRSKFMLTRLISIESQPKKIVVVVVVGIVVVVVFHVFVVVIPVVDARHIPLKFG